jgi:signal transduction histidine kinase
LIDPNSISELTLAGLVHDLNNVFETILEASELITGDPRWKTLAATIQRNVDRGQRIVGSILDTTRAGQDLDVVVDRAASFVEDFLALVGHAPVAVERSIPAGIRLRGLAADWERVFMNLFLNAVQAMPDGGAVEVNAEERNDAVIIGVLDNGPGIANEILRDIFKPRFSTRSEHTGMGLHIVASIVARYGGTVAASNRPGRTGAWFRIALPPSGGVAQ